MLEDCGSCLRVPFEDEGLGATEEEEFLPDCCVAAALLVASFPPLLPSLLSSAW